ncbi:MAG: hypothetical protein WB507_02475 [Solirubrobacterales bacterium]
MPAPTQNQYEPCEECGAPLDPQQRYCVNCAARRGNGANPASRYFATMSKRARRPVTRPPARPSTSRAAAVGFFALLPIAVAIGVLVGRDGTGNNDQALLEALRHQNATAAATSTTAAKTAATPKASASKKDGKGEAKGGNQVIASKNGPITKVTGFKPTKKLTQEDTKLVENNVKQVGKNYIKAQTNLPSVIVVGGPSSGSGGH